ncbi:FAD-dependent oxidoreductase [Dyadobacter sandarakinus]|uniref:Flavin-dependent monooxygenase n=1 Tax=Dyadobacter sandarakinus TaxID=2747268 RepID=A0ABX7I5T8_9BACT|nr:NAD(P)/FAD-dependent oxidoreductase [Dyadobacter sandarakinus]QRR01150.1 FAD-dependent monooxygenase [Dyadobacter sandarakinus]
MLILNKQIAIVGGGPGGLTLARLLQMNGANVKVFERDINRNARVQGSPLDMHKQSGLKALIRAGLLETFKKHYRVGADRKTIVNENANVLFTTPLIQASNDFNDENFHPEIDRGTLRDLLLQSLEPDTVVWNSQFISMIKQKSGWLLHFGNGKTFYADIVIAADGANSKIRPYITDTKPVYSGITMIEGHVHDAKNTLPNIHALINDGALLAFGNERNLFMGLKSDGDLTFYTSFKATENWYSNAGLDYNNSSEMLNWFRKDYITWSKIWYPLFENAATPFVPRPIYCMPPDHTWKSLPNLTMLGDAAHVMPPSAGEGANMAMLDAVELCDCLSKEGHPDLQTAIAIFEQNMQRRASEMARVSLANGEWMHSPGSLDKMLAMFGAA